MIKILYDNKEVRECANMTEAQNTVRSYLNLMLSQKLEIKEIEIDIYTIGKPKRHIIIKETLPAGIIKQQIEIPQIDPSFPNTIQ